MTFGMVDLETGKVFNANGIFKRNIGIQFMIAREMPHLDVEGQLFGNGRRSL